MSITGSLQIRNTTYYMMVRIPKEDGTYLQKSKTTKIKAQGKNQRETKHNKLEASKMLARWIDELSNNVGVANQKPLIAAIDEWLARKKRSLRQDTYEAYACNYNHHIKPYFESKKLRLCDVTPRIIQRYVDDKETSGQSPSSVKKHLVILNGVFNDAIKMGELSVNPCAKITPSRCEKFTGRAYNAEESRLLLSILHNDPVEPAVYLGLYLGLRRSEVAGLRWMDVDFANDLVHIRNTVVRFNTVSEQEKTKSKASKRDLFLPSGLKVYLLKLKEKQKGNHSFLGLPFSEESHVCQWQDGRPYQPEYISVRFRALLKKHGLPKIRFHDLRHTAGSLLINQGQSVKQVQEFLGHEQVSTTLDIYTHLSQERKKDTALAIDSLLSDAGTPEKKR